MIDERPAKLEARLRELRHVRTQPRDIARRAEGHQPDDCDGDCGLIPRS